jgi:hypothetical protein
MISQRKLPLLGPSTFRSTDIVTSRVTYEIAFIITTTGVIDRIDIASPWHQSSSRRDYRTEGIGPGSHTKSGSTVTLAVHTPISISAGTFIRLEMVGIGNPSIGQLQNLCSN